MDLQELEVKLLDIDDNISTIVDTLCAISALSDLVRFTKQVQLNDELYIHKIIKTNLAN